MYFIFLFVGYFVGLTIFSLTVIQILIILRAGIPTTKELVRVGALINPRPIMTQYIGSLITLVGFFSLITLLVHWFGGSGFILGYYIGSIFSFVMGIGKTGRTDSFMMEYLASNARYLATQRKDLPRKK